jgi:hypothetical protein
VSGIRYRALLIAVLAASLAGCWKEQQQELNYCATHIRYNSKYPPLAHIATPMTLCMDKAGYQVAYDNPYCPTIAIPRRSPYCYVPKGSLAGIGFKLEMIYQPGPTPPTRPVT